MNHQINTFLNLPMDTYNHLLEFQGIKSKQPSVYFDLDGTLAEWIPDRKGLTMEEMFEPKYHYFRNLNPYPAQVLFAKSLVDMGVDICIISAADQRCIEDKYEWVKEHLPFIKEENIFICPLGADKTKFVKGNADHSLLLDDYPVNLKAWSGKAVKVLNGVNSPTTEFEQIDFHSWNQDYEQSKQEIMDFAKEFVSMELHQVSLDLSDFFLPER